MAAGGDIVELTHEQSYLGQICNNVYFFEAAVADASLSGLAAWFETNVLPDIKIIQNSSVLHVNLRLRNLFNFAETYEEPLTGTGTRPAGVIALPSFVALQVRFDHISNTVRPGFKRFVGVDEAHLETALLTAAVITSTEAVAANLVNPPADANPEWAHVIVGRVCDEINPIAGAIPSCLRYVLPRTQAEAAIGGIGYPVTYEVFSQVTSQNSRKWYT